MEIIFSEENKKKSSNQGLLIAMCGFDGSGKTTQINALKGYFESKGREVCLTRQPTSWYRENSTVRRYLQNGGNASEARALALFAAADRRMHIHEIVNPAVSYGKIVITDRYVFSSLAYFKSRGVPMDFVAYINQDIPCPDASFFLDVPPKILVDRLEKRDGPVLKFEERDILKMAEIRQAFFEMRKYLEIIDGNLSPPQVSKQIFEHTDELLNRKK